MDMNAIRGFFLWCFVINMGILLVWFGVISLAPDFVYHLHGKWFNLTPERFGAIHYTGMMFFKIAVFGFNLVPYLALLIIGNG